MNANRAGLVATCITLLYTCLGLPAQILENYRNHSVHGLSLFMSLLVFCTFSSWVVYGSLRRDKYIIISNLTGWIGIVIILVQFYLYR